MSRTCITNENNSELFDGCIVNILMVFHVPPFVLAIHKEILSILSQKSQQQNTWKIAVSMSGASSAAYFRSLWSPVGPNGLLSLIQEEDTRTISYRSFMLWQTHTFIPLVASDSLWALSDQSAIICCIVARVAAVPLQQISYQLYSGHGFPVMHPKICRINSPKQTVQSGNVRLSDKPFLPVQERGSAPLHQQPNYLRISHCKNQSFRARICQVR